MTIGQVLAGVRLRTELPATLASQQISGLDYDSRRVEKGFLFFAFPGARVDGREFAAQAAGRGAVAIVSELPPAGEAPASSPSTPWIQVEHGRHALALAARTFYGNQDEHL